jgi:hypothetical protein
LVVLPKLRSGGQSKSEFCALEGGEGVSDERGGVCWCGEGVVCETCRSDVNDCFTCTLNLDTYGWGVCAICLCLRGQRGLWCGIRSAAGKFVVLDWGAY